MPQASKRNRAAPVLPARKVGAGGAGPEVLQSEVRGARGRNALVDSEQAEMFDLMLADLDARIDAVVARTDRIMARAGLA